MKRQTHSEDNLVAEAARVRENAFVPFSNFKVGAAPRAGSGAIHSGCSTEHAADPHGARADAWVMAAMVAEGDTEIKEACLKSDSPEPVTPCMGGRQKLAELAAADVKITTATIGGKRVILTTAEILLGAFNMHHMSKT
ncbi:MAG: cytidine deaminase [Pseudomonadota bacterium]